MGNLQLIGLTELSQKIQVSESTIYSWTAQNRIPHYKIGRHLRFDLVEVLDHFKKTSNKGLTMTPKRLKQDSLETEYRMRKRMGLP